MDYGLLILINILKLNLFGGVTLEIINFWETYFVVEDFQD